MGKPIVGWVADNSLPRFGRLLEEPHSRRVFAIDVTRQWITPLASGPGLQVEGPAGSYIFDVTWHPDYGQFFAFGRTHNRGSWALLHVGEDGSTRDVGAPADTAVMSLCYSDDGDLILGVASVEGADGRQIGGGIASFSPWSGSFHWLYRPPEGEHFVPSGICWDSGAVLFVHTSRHALMRLIPDGRLECVTGHFGQPASDLRGLNTPTGLTASDGRYLVTDSGNHRVLRLDRDGGMLGSFGGTEQGAHLIDPRHALGAEDKVYVADLGARSVLELGTDLRSMRARWGGPAATGLVLSRPRSIDRAATGELVIADTNNNRVIGVDDDGGLRWQLRELKRADGRSEALRWPRSARISDGGRLVVSDSLNSRFIVVARDGSIENEFGVVRLGNDSFTVSDPHDGRWLGDDELLVVDSASGWVARVGCDGIAAWVVTGLNDPHQAAAFDDRVVIVDPEMDTVLLVDAATGTVLWRRNEFFDSAGNRYRLFKPRVVHTAFDCVLIVDADSQVVALGQDWLVRWTWSGGLAPAGGRDGDFEVPDAPRDLLMDHRNKMLLTDYRRNCVLELQADQ
ncbi:NHL repeat-containing protein [Nocardia sp. NPDC047648]|uniref:NHL repeat-containing protein n=1 Tax=Nocardia sp. NPDC047648 TaxID=3155625 RepID=UPI0034042323